MAATLIVLALLAAVSAFWFARGRSVWFRLLAATISLTSVVGLATLTLLAWSALSPHSFRPRLGHIVIAAFSDPNDIVGRLSLQSADGDYSAFPGNRPEKMLAVYENGRLLTAHIAAGPVTLSTEPALKLDLRYLLLGR